MRARSAAEEEAKNCLPVISAIRRRVSLSRGAGLYPPPNSSATPSGVPRATVYTGMPCALAFAPLQWRCLSGRVGPVGQQNYGRRAFLLRLRSSRRHLFSFSKLGGSFGSRNVSCARSIAIKRYGGSVLPAVMGARPISCGRSSRFVPKALCPSIRAVQADGKMQPSGKGGRCPASGPSQAE